MDNNRSNTITNQTTQPKNQVLTPSFLCFTVKVLIDSALENPQGLDGRAGAAKSA
jgi:hypothetical protein